MKGTILLIEDDVYISELIEFNLKNDEYEVVSVRDANEGLLFLKNNRVDLIILDLMLPGLQGEEFLDILKNKSEYKSVPVIIITAKTDEDLMVKLLKLGADDFLIKPFSVKILLAKVDAVLRRVKKDSSPILKAYDVEVFLDEFIVKVDGVVLEFTKTEFDILKILMQNKGKVLTRDRILHEIWGFDASVSDRTVDVHVSKIRKKLGSKGYLIKSIPKVGYKFSS